MDARVALLGLLVACGGASPDPGARAWLGIANAQFVPGAMPAGDAAGPAVASVYVSHNTVGAGTTGLKLTGSLALGANAAAIGLDGDAGYWVVTAGPADVQAPDQLTFGVRASFSLSAPTGPRTLLVRAVDRGGRFGLPFTVAMQVEEQPEPPGELVISLSWDTESDLDLHVVDPQGTEVWSGNENSWERPPPGTPFDPNAWKTGGILDLDSNARCVIDGVRRENVAWQSSPPSGRYVVRVDTASLCQAATASWHAAVRLQGVPILEARGTSTAASTRFPHGLGAGVLALEFELP
jgi:hypothetical protein